MNALRVEFLVLKVGHPNWHVLVRSAMGYHRPEHVWCWVKRSIVHGRRPPPCFDVGQGKAQCSAFSLATSNNPQVPHLDPFDCYMYTRSDRKAPSSPEQVYKSTEYLHWAPSNVSENAILFGLLRT